MAYLQYCVHHAAQPARFLIKNELVLQRGELDMPKTQYVCNFRHVMERGLLEAILEATCFFFLNEKKEAWKSKKRALAAEWGRKKKAKCNLFCLCPPGCARPSFSLSMIILLHKPCRSQTQQQPQGPPPDSARRAGAPAAT